MERKQATRSVISQFMGLDDPKSRQVSHRPIKVLSEDYLRKISTLVLLQNTSVREKRSPKRTSEKQHGTDHRFGSPVRAQSSGERQENARATNFRPVAEQICHSDMANLVPRSTHRLRAECGARRLDESQSKVVSGYSSTRIPKSNSEKHLDWLRKITENQNASKSVESLRCKLRDSNVGQTKARNLQVDFRIKSRSKTSVGDCTGSSLSSASRSIKIERWRNSKHFQEVCVSDKRCQVDNFSTPLVQSYKIRSANEYLRRLTSRANAMTSSVADETSVGVSEWSRQKLSQGFPEGELILTRGARDSMSVKNLREMSQLSPDSVLEPTFFKEDQDSEESESDSPTLDRSGLAMKLTILNNESDASLEGSVMSVSTDRDSKKGSVDLSQDYEKLWRPWRPEESRDFSYLIDVLDEATLFGLNLDTWCETLQEVEHPLSPLLFETLEKKYGKQTSWHKSERRLLFDYVNSGLKAIQGSYMDCSLSELPLKRRFSATPVKRDIEEELSLQFTREKEAKKDSPDKAFLDEMKWLELEDDISTICKDIAEILFDELAAEIYSST